MVLVAGTVNPAILGKHRRLQEYAPSDFGVVANELAKRQGLLILPNVATQASDLLSQTDQTTARILRSTLAHVLQQHREHYVPSAQAAQRSEHILLGLTDAAILQALGPGITLLTSDFALHGKAVALRLMSVNINHLRFIV